MALAAVRLRQASPKNSTKARLTATNVSRPTCPMTATTFPRATGSGLSIRFCDCTQQNPLDPATVCQPVLSIPRPCQGGKTCKRSVLRERKFLTTMHMISRISGISSLSCLSCASLFQFCRGASRDISIDARRSDVRVRLVAMHPGPLAPFVGQGTNLCLANRPRCQCRRGGRWLEPSGS